MKKRMLINSIIIFLVFFIATIFGFKDELILIILSVLITALIVCCIFIFLIIYNINKRYDEIRDSYCYLKELLAKRYKLNFKLGINPKDLESEILEYNTNIEIISNGISISINDYLRYKINTKFLFKTIYRNRKDELLYIKKETEKILKSE